MMQLFDSHLHLNHPDFLGREAAAWSEAQAAGVAEGVVIGYDLESSRRAVALAERLPGLYASAGVSPHDVLAAPAGYLDELERLAGHPRVAAVGECGLEYHYPAGPKETQIKHFIQQIELANRLNKAVVIHLRDADADFLSILDTCPPAAAILHCFTASREVMEKAAARGYGVSFSGIVTFQNARDLQILAAEAPDMNLLVETDAPYLAPEPYRGRRCEPYMIPATVSRLAALRKTSVETIAEQTRANARRVLRIAG
ncbi:MAG: TatD family hydrolase [bacterium]